MMPIRYSTNWMGPINMGWIEKNGSDWAGGRIDTRSGDWSYPEEIGLPMMKQEDFNKFSNWLDTIETDDVWTLQQLVEQYEKTNPKIQWYHTPE